MASMDAVMQELMNRAKIALHHGHYGDALYNIDRALQLPGVKSHWTSPFLHIRAECFWLLGEYQECLRVMHETITVGLPLRSIFETREEYNKWMARGESLLNSGSLLARGFFDLCKVYCQTSKERAWCFVFEGVATCAFDQGRGLQLINVGHELDRNILEETSNDWKTKGIQAFKMKNYQRSKQLLQRALIVTPNDSLHSEPRRSILSHLATVHFILKEYQLALDAGEKSFSSKPVPSQEEALRWKERGKTLFKEKKFELLIKYYSLAIGFTPQGGYYIELRSMLLSNRSIAYNKTKKYFEALADAKECVRINPDWSKGQYRLGTSLIGLGRFQEALASFCSAFKVADVSETKEIALQILSVGDKLEDGFARESLSMPNDLVQELIRKVVDEKDWKKLHLLFVGGGGTPHHGYGKGGLATGLGCDASKVPLELIVEWGINKSVAYLPNFVEELIKQGAPILGSPGCEESPLQIADRRSKKELLEVLTKYDKTQGKYWKDKGVEQFRLNNFVQAICFLTTAAKCHLTKEEQIETYTALSEACYVYKDYQKAIESARKLYNLRPLRSKGIAEKWKNRGNILLGDKNYDIMIECYTLALDYALMEDTDMRAAIYGNRSMAYLNQKSIAKAKDDATVCIRNRPSWFRGYSRLASCFIAENDRQGAVIELCRGLRAVQTDEEKFNLANDIVSLTKKKDTDWIIIPGPIPSNIINKLIKQTVGQKDWDTLRFLFLEKTCQHNNGSMHTLAHDVRNLSFVPLDIIFQSDVKDKQRLVLELLAHGASPNGGPNCTRTPLQLAVDMQDFKMAERFLQFGAEHSQILLQSEMFDRSESSQGLQWLSLARKTKHSKNFRRAEMFYRLALEYKEITRDSRVHLDALRSLSEMSFASGKYDECLTYGYRCLKLVSTKSEEEAKRWQERGETLIKIGIFSELPSYLTLALNYAPPSSKPLRYKLLCRRSYAYHEIDDLQPALEDGNNATSIQPDDVEGYKCVVRCYRSLGRESRTLYNLNQCLRTERNPQEQKQYFEEAMDIAVKLPESTTVLTIEVPTSFIVEVQGKAIQSENWEMLRLLYLGGGGPEQLQVGKGGLATKRVRADRVPIEDVVSANFTSKPDTMSVLLDHGALVNGLRGNAIPLVCAVAKGQVEVAKVLVDHGANPCVKTDSNNQPLLHNVVQKAIDTGSVEMLRCLVLSKHAEIENLQDPKGCSLYHLAMNGKFNHNKIKVIKLLTEANVNPTLKNKANQQPLDYHSKRDDRNKMISKFIKHYIPKVKEEKKQETDKPDNGGNSRQTKVVNEEIEQDPGKVPIAAEPRPRKSSSDAAPVKVLPSETKPPKSKTQYDEEKKELWRKNSEYLIERLTIVKHNLSHQTMDDEASEEVNGHIRQDNEKQEETVAVGEEQEREQEEAAEEEEEEEAEAEAEEDGPETDENEAEEKSRFENLTWEVECTQNVWKTLESKKVAAKMKNGIAAKIRMLAQGRWSSKKVCKRLEGEPKKKKIQLYESHLDKGARMLWERAIAFSPRCSNHSKLRLGSYAEGVETSGGSGRIYSEIIRVWSIVLDHKNLEHQIENVVKSHERGSHCIIKADLKGCRKKKSSFDMCYPAIYQERRKDDPPANKESTFFPPASSKDNEFHILKFYSVTSAVISTLLDGDGKTKIDFPFKVTELEDAIIHLKPKPPCPIILLGRSGTGKTTCCLYRLWTEFQYYWQNAATAGPHIPKCIAADTNIEEEEAFGNCTKSDYVEEHLTSSISERDDVVVRDDDWTNEQHFPNHEDDQENVDANLMEDCTPELYEHFHPLFVTKNTVLCNEVQKNFKELRNACPVTKAMTTPANDSIPNRIQDIIETSWPLFIGARDWLLLLDASLPGETFFKRAKDGKLLKNIEGWGKEDTHLHFIPEEEDDDEFEFEEEEGQHVAVEDDTRVKPQDKDIMREVTYQVFRDELWPKMNKKIKASYHPTLVWTEIRSFIKGSVEAVETEHGSLSQQEYEDIGRKRAPNFTGDRSTVYDLFQNYQRICNRQRMFDEADLVYRLNKRVIENPKLSWSIHSVYVDETQDFTQAELSLLIRCCRFQNRMFFTGDTAQSIMRGIAFRFEDLRTLFHGIKQFNMMTTTQEAVRIPDRLYQLTHNYRSHAGILRLASSVVNLLSRYFPESFDKLEDDRGLFDGPKPVLLESCSISDLAMILRGNKRETSRIEFGAHQAVLVVSEEARDNMPEELKHGLVLTIYEAKGLEFDDVLIYNFFKESHAKKEWRVVTSYIEEKKKQIVSGTAGLVEFQEKDLILKTRPLEFEPDKHKVLNSEFKYLYTAITRARVNVWFFDQDEESRAPMFEYFRRLNLVRAITLEDEEEGTATSLSSMFAESSTKEEWRQQGVFFYNKDLWVVAEKCFVFAEDEFMVRKCKAQQQAQEALKSRSNKSLMKEKFGLAATKFLECNMIKEAVICLRNARERLLVAKLYKKMENFSEASNFFRLVAHHEEASECMEIMNNYSQAIEILCEAKLYEKAIEVLERYNSLKIDEMLCVPPKPNRTIERLCYKLAETHFKDDNIEEMERVLQRLPSTDDRISFFMKHECIEEAARALVDNDRGEEAAQFLQLHGKFKAAKRYSKDLKFLGDCSLYEARELCMKQNADSEVIQLLEDAIKYYRRCKDQNGEAEALLFLGRQKDDPSLIKESGKIFDNSYNTCGECEVADEWLKRGNLTKFYYRITVRTIERLLDLIIDLHKPYTQLKTLQQKKLTLCEQFFGLLKVEDTQIRSYRTCFCERFRHIAELQDNSRNMQVEVDVKFAYQAIVGNLIAKAVDLSQAARVFFMTKLEFKASDDSHLQDDLSFHEKFEIIFNWVYLDSVTVKFHNRLKQLGSSKILSEGEKVLPQENERFLSCKLFTEFIFPETGFKVHHPIAEQIEKIRKHHAVKPRLIQYCKHHWKSLETQKEVSMTDVFLQVSQVMQLLDMRDQGVNLYLKAKEDSFKKNQITRKLMRESGMMQLQERFGNSYEIFLRYFEIGKKTLYMKGDVFQSLHETSRRFLTYTARSYGRFYPSIANTLMILEHQLTVSLIMVARLKRKNTHFCCCIPESYLSRLRLTDDLNCTKRGQFTTFKAVEQDARPFTSLQEVQTYLRRIQSLQSYFVDLMFGLISYDFNVFYDTFSTESSDKSMADRTLVLALTMLVNCGKVLYADCEGVILQNIFTVIPDSSLPAHLKTAFKEMNEVKSISDAVKVLKNLLRSRNSEKLFDVRWNNTLRLDTIISNPDNYNLFFDVNLSELKAEAKAESSRPIASQLDTKEQEEDEEDDNTVDADSNSRILEREKEGRDQKTRLDAAIKLQRMFRRMFRRMRSRKEKRFAEGKDHLDATEDRLSAFKADSSACTICGVDFQDTPDRNPESPEVPKSHADHVASQDHKTKQEQFEKYKEMYVSRVQKVLSRVRHLDERRVTGMELDRQQLDGFKARVWAKVKDIENRQEWQDTNGLISMLEDLEKKVKGFENVADQVQAGTPTDSTDRDEDPVEGDIDYDDEGDLEVLPTTRKQRKTREQSSKERRRQPRKGR